MPTEQVVEKLKALQEQLDTISSAVIHIDEAAQVASNASNIASGVAELVQELKSLELEHLNELRAFHAEKVVELEQSLLKLLTSLEERGEDLAQIISETRQLETAIGNYFTEIRSINFPERLDKIDNQISAINIGIGNLQTGQQQSQDKAERYFDQTVKELNQAKDNLKTDLVAHITLNINELISQLQQQNSLLKKELNINRIISGIGVLAVFILGVYVLIKL